MCTSASSSNKSIVSPSCVIRERCDYFQYSLCRPISSISATIYLRLFKMPVLYKSTSLNLVKIETLIKRCWLGANVSEIYLLIICWFCLTEGSLESAVIIKHENNCSTEVVLGLCELQITIRNIEPHPQKHRIMPIWPPLHYHALFVRIMKLITINGWRNKEVLRA